MKRREFIAAAAAVPAAAALPNLKEPESIATDLPLILIEDGEITNLQDFLNHANLEQQDNPKRSDAKILAFLPEETPKCAVLDDGSFKHTINMFWGEVTLIIYREKYQSQDKTNTYTFAEIRPTQKSKCKILHANMFYDFREAKWE
jgi:hypothetical protein